MKRIGNLYSKICSIDNLNLADERARLGKLNTYGVRIHDENREQNIKELRSMLVNKTFNTSAYKTFVIKEPKERTIYSLPYFPDRIVHHAIMNVMEPIWKSLFISQTYSCIKGKGVHNASFDLRKALKNDVEGTKYCLQLDIRKFYPTVDHDILIAVLEKKIKDKDLMWLINNIVRSAEGLPIGNYLSQYFANIYLAYFDHWVKEELKVKYYYRYADDMILLSNSKQQLWHYFYNMQEYLNAKLKLEVKDNYRVFPVSNGIDFVGYVHYHTHTLLRKRIKKSFARAVKRGKRESIVSYYGWAKHADTYNLLNKLNYESSESK